MAWLGGTSCDGYATADLGKRFVIVGSGGIAVSPGTGRFGTNSIRCSTGNGYVGMAAVTSSATVITGRAFRTAIVGTEFPFCEVWDGLAGQGQVLYTINTDGSISAWRVGASNPPMRYAGSTRLGTSAPGIIQPNIYYSIVIKTTISATTGVCVVKVNGATVLNLTAQNTRNASASGNTYTVLLDGLGATVTTVDVDDLWACDDTGAQNNDFPPGDIIGEWSVVNGAGASSGWTKNSGATNASCVDDSTPDGDTTIVSAGTVGLKDTYTHAALTRITGGIVCVQTIAVAKVASPGTRAIGLVLRSAGTDYVGSDHYLPADYATQIDVHELDPATSAAWANPAAVNATEVGEEVTV